MKHLKCILIIFLYLIFTVLLTSDTKDQCMTSIELTDHPNEDDLISSFKKVIPELEGKKKGDAGKIAIIGGSTEYTGAPYFAAMSALRVGADLVYVITTDSAAPVIKSYSPDLIVYPYLNTKFIAKINLLLSKMDTIVIGPGLGRDDEIIKLTSDIIETCRVLRKPLVIDADGLYVVSKNLSIILDFPSPGIILTPNYLEQKRLTKAVLSLNNSSNWQNYWGENIAVLNKGASDEFHSMTTPLNWVLSNGGSGRRAGGQGDILSGALGTFYYWTLKSNICNNNQSIQVAQTLAAFAAATFTRTCNFKAYSIHGRSMLASDMLNEINSSFDILFNKE